MTYFGHNFPIYKLGISITNTIQEVFSLRERNNFFIEVGLREFLNQTLHKLMQGSERYSL